jgi:hypothetical protein
MLEPLTLSIPEIAARWKQTSRQILERAASMKLSLLFNFDGLAIDDKGARLTQFDLDQQREHERLTMFVKLSEAKFQANLQEFRNTGISSLTDTESTELRKEVTDALIKMKIIEMLSDEVTMERHIYHYRGYLIASPETVNDLLRQGFTNHPIRAFSLDGRMVRLEPAIAKWKERLMPDDMLAYMADVKAIEAAALPDDANSDEQVKPKTNKRIWDDTHLLSLLDESNQPNVTQAVLAKNYSVSRQRISELIKQAKEIKEPKTASQFSMQHTWTGLSKKNK